VILENYNKGVILVYSMPRSGTTLFCKFLERKLNIINAGEIFHNNNERAQKTANLAINLSDFHNKDFICKYFPGNDTFDQSKFNGRQNFYRVNLVRKNIARQFTSLIIAQVTDEWQTVGFGKAKSDTTRKKIEINRGLLKLEFYKFVETLYIKEKVDNKIKYDEELYYEDIIDYLNENKQNDIVNIPSIKPINYNYIYIEVVNLIKSYVKNNNNTPDIMLTWYNDFQKNGFKT
jgi:hypothetical protein